jgi:hypothetical protein
MKKSLAKLTFTPHESGKLKIPTASTWYSITCDCQPNDWSIRIIPMGDPTPDNTVMAEIDFLMDAADYLLKCGTKFNIHGYNSFNCQIEIVKEL